MKRLAALALVLTLLVPGVATAHHVPVTATVDTTDSTALNSYVAEYSASFGVVIAALTRYIQVADADRLVVLQNALVTGIDHLTGLEVRACYAEVQRLSIADFEAAVIAITAHKAQGGDTIDFTVANIAHGLALEAARAAVVACSTPVLPSNTEALV